MIKIEFKRRDEPNIPFSNIEEIFCKTEVKDTPVVRQMIAEIEGGRYFDPYRFKDKFGTTLSVDYLSTSCKAAIILALGYKEKLDLTECGDNALNAILKHCRNGNVVLVEPYPISWTTDTSSDDSCDIEFNGYRFTSLARLVFYINDEWGFDDGVDLEMEGIEKLPK